MKPTLSRKRACFYGLAIGDALGAPVEFMGPHTFPRVTGYQSGGPHRLLAGQWTDDTSMALALADSLLHVGWDPVDQMRRYIDWHRSGAYSITGSCFDIGITTAKALRKFKASHDPETSGDPQEAASGNGSIMRLAPVAIYTADRYATDPNGIIDLAVASSRPTHASLQCLLACAILGLTLGALINGLSLHDAMSPDGPVLRRVRKYLPVHSDFADLMSGRLPLLHPPRIQGAGYVVRTLEAALWAVATSRSFEEAVLKAVNLGDDADTVGAVCGQIAGARWGMEGIPTHFLTGLDLPDCYGAIIERLCALKGP